MPAPKEALVSPFPTASIARVLAPHEKKLGATLVARHLAHLAVKVTFHKQPCFDLEVKFYKVKDDASKDTQLGDPVKTDRTGVARLDHLVDAGLYVCEIENQARPVAVATVSDPAKPYVIPTPVDRPYFDFEEDPEFDHEVREVQDYDGAGDGDGFVAGDAEAFMTVAFATKADDALDAKFPKFLLEASDGSYSREITAAQALQDRGGYKQIVFRNLTPGATYRLTEVHDEGYRRVVFDDAPYEAIVAQKHDAGQLLEDHKFQRFEVGSPADVGWT